MRLCTIFSLVCFPLLAGAAPLFPEASKAGAKQATETMGKTAEGVEAADLQRHLQVLCSEAFEGRNTATAGGYMATTYASACFAEMGLEPGGDEETWFQGFPYSAGYTVPQDSNSAVLDWGSGVYEDLRMRGNYAPLTFSPNREIAAADIVFAGHGIQAGGFDNFAGLDVKDKWVMVVRGVPEGDDLPADAKQQGPLIAKAENAKKLGALGVIYIKAGNQKIPAELTQFTSVGQRGRILPAISIRNELADQLLGNRKLDEVYKTFNQAEAAKGFSLDAQLKTTIKVDENKTIGRNVVGVLRAGDEPSEDFVVMCAHIDHLGFGKSGGSRAKGKQRNALHPGADDNASGTAVLFEVAQALAARKKAGKLMLKRDIVFIAFSGEEMGLYGSRFYVNQLKEAKALDRVHACLNLDMIGRLKTDFTLTGISTSDDWNAVLDTVGAPEGLSVKRANRAPGGDSLPFSNNGIPALFGITGMHDDYHTPADTLDKLNVPGLALIATYLSDAVAAVANSGDDIVYKKPPARERPPRVVIGIVPEDAEDGGVVVTSVSERAPASEGGMKVDDVITSLNGKEVANVQGLFRVLRTLKPDEEVPVEVKRGEETVKLKIKPAARR